MHKTKLVSEQSLTKMTRQLLKDRPRSLSLHQIAADTGVSVHWLSKFISSADNCDAAATRVQSVYERLTGKPLLDSGV